MSERLEEIKNRYLVGIHILYGTTWVTIPKEDFDWLIEQAERVEELEEERDEWKDTAQFYYMTNQELREQNKRYREVLEEIARGRFPGASYKARQALRSDEN